MQNFWPKLALYLKKNEENRIFYTCKISMKFESRISSQNAGSLPTCRFLPRRRVPSLDWYFLIQFSVLLMWLAYYSDLKIQKWPNLDKLYRWVLGFFYFWAIFGVNFDPLMVSRLWMGQFLLKYDMLYHFGNGRTTARHMCWFWNNISTLRWFFGAKYTF